MEAITKNNFWKHQAPAFLFAIFIFIMSSIPKLPKPELEIVHYDKIGHAIVYAILAFLICRALVYQHQFISWRRNYALLGIVLGTLYGISDEVHQSFVPGRTADIYDVAADMVGSVIGVFIFRYVYNRYFNTESQIN